MATLITIAISDVANGTKVALQEDGGERVEYVVQASDDERRAVEAWREALQTIYEQHGPGSGRYAAARLWLTVAPGDKHVGFEDTLYQ
jgi:hypothetical protein